MPNYRFSVIVPAAEMTHDEILDATDALAGAGCTDASIRGTRQGFSRYSAFCGFLEMEGGLGSILIE
jgi:hypothetical protein